MKGMEAIIAKAVQDSGFSKKKIEELTSMMVTYLNTGAKYGTVVEGFLHWYVNDMGGTLHDDYSQ